MKKAALVAMCNPYSNDPRLALWPDPVGCSGWRLWRIIDDAGEMDKLEYLDSYLRMNLVAGREWDPVEAREAGADLLRRPPSDRIVVLGVETWRSIFRALPPAPLSSVQPNATWHFLPHPSGRCHWYNNPENRRRAGNLLLELGRVPCAA